MGETKFFVVGKKNSVIDQMKTVIREICMYVGKLCPFLYFSVKGIIQDLINST